ncbi:hypothetical protein NMY22_g16939 [Coprinellus aureogranulatus]|nr:hypothetical protein NMY22_g16939 [Coprinellus aureogranulatus]
MVTTMMPRDAYYYYLVGSAWHNQALPKLDGNEDFIPDDSHPMPFLLEFNKGQGDTVKYVWPLINSLCALDKQYMASPSITAHKTLVA